MTIQEEFRAMTAKNAKQATFYVMFFASVFPLLSLLGCQRSAEDVGNSVRESMQETFDKDPTYTKYHLFVDSVTAVKDRDNSYIGIAKIRYAATEHNVDVHITCDSDHVLWKTDQGAFLFIAEQDGN